MANVVTLVDFRMTGKDHYDSRIDPKTAYRAILGNINYSLDKGELQVSFKFPQEVGINEKVVGTTMNVKCELNRKEYLMVRSHILAHSVLSHNIISGILKNATNGREGY